MSSASNSSALLEHAYVELDLGAGRLLGAASPATHPAEWRSVGDWLLLAERVGAQRIFFVDDDPVLVFSALEPGASDQEVLNAYRLAWSLARPRCLFLAVGGELRVYALSQAPVADGSAERLTPLETVTRLADVADQLANFHRVRVESGDAFAALDAERPHRADQQLMRDVELATNALEDAGLESQAAHRLIERAILVRYLEDRGVLTPAYFEQVASAREEWRGLLDVPPPVPSLGPSSWFTRCLADRELTAAVFARLAQDFNGDLFVSSATDEATLVQLVLLRDLLLGASTTTGQQRLFLWAYDFSVVPTALVSTMYELFYNREEKGGQSSVYYTPPQLVEFVLADLLDERLLDTEPSICDPACGSGAFLVEAFRRLVRHKMSRLGRPLQPDELKVLLLDRLRGVDVDESAVQLAAFSLYVAYLNYQSPADILEAGPLPSLIDHGSYVGERRPLTVANAFWPTSAASDHAQSEVGTSGRTARGECTIDWPAGGYNVVVGNPPWTKPARGSSRVADDWAEQRGFAVGDRNPSQLFIWRALDLLSEGGVAALLISARALLGVRGRYFRAQWLTEARLEHVVNFSEVRGAYFHDAKSPFALVRFRRSSEPPDGPVVYETAKRAGPEDSSPAYVRLERRLPKQRALRERDHLWKTSMTGGRRDEALLERLEDFGSLRQITSEQYPPRFGYQAGKPGQPSAHPPGDELASLQFATDFLSWGRLELQPSGDVPALVKWPGHPRLYDGRRLVVGLGVIADTWLHARLEEQPFAYTHRTYGIPLQHRPRWQAQVALATLLSATGRYWLYMNSRAWGSWRDQVRKEELMRLPIRLTASDDPQVRRLADAVDQLPGATAQSEQAGRLFDEPPQGDLVNLLREIDESVNELFEMTDAESELIGDFWASRGPLGRSPVERDGLSFGYADDIARGPHDGIRAYLKTFLRFWNAQLGEDGEVSWQLVGDARASVLCAIFETRSLRAERAEPDRRIQESWEQVLARVGANTRSHPSASLRRYGSIRAVSDTAIIVIKRNERRLWSASAARDDAEATTVQAMAMHGS